MDTVDCQSKLSYHLQIKIAIRLVNCYQTVQNKMEDTEHMTVFNVDGSSEHARKNKENN